MGMSILFAFMSMYHTCAVPMNARGKGIRSLVTGVKTSRSEQPCGCWEPTGS